jgi:hypothetical protein
MTRERKWSGRGGEPPRLWPAGSGGSSIKRRRRRRRRRRTSWLARAAGAGAGGAPEPLPFVVGVSPFCCPCRLSAPSRWSRRTAPRGWKAEDGAAALIHWGLISAMAAAQRGGVGWEGDAVPGRRLGARGAVAGCCDGQEVESGGCRIECTARRAGWGYQPIMWRWPRWRRRHSPHATKWPHAHIADWNAEGKHRLVGQSAICTRPSRKAAARRITSPTFQDCVCDKRRLTPPGRSTQQATGHGACKTQNYYCSCYSHYHSSSHYHKFSQLGYGQQPQDEFKKESSGGSTAALAVPLQLLCPHSPDRIGSKLLGGVYAIFT